MSCDFSTLSHPGIQDLSPYVPGKSIAEVANQYGIHDIIKLGSNENALGCSPKVTEALRQVKSLEIMTYPSHAHHPFHRELSNFLQVSEPMLTLGNGSDSLFGLVLIAFALLQDKHIIVHDYAFNSYAIQAKTFGIAVKSLALQKWQIHVENLIAACTPQTAAIFIDNPGNPIGAYLDVAAVEEILVNIPETTLLVLDEAYHEYLPPAAVSSLSLLNKYKNLIITRTFSKAYGLAGLRLGYAIANPQITAVIQKVHLPFAINHLAMDAGRVAIYDQDFISHTRNYIANERQIMAQFLDKHAIGYLPPSSNFVTLDCGSHSAPSVARYLEQRGIICRPLTMYGLHFHLRVTIGSTEQNQRFRRELVDILAMKPNNQDK